MKFRSVVLRLLSMGVFELEMKVLAKRDLVQMKVMFSQSLLRAAVNSANSWQREARVLHNHLPFSSAT